MRQIRKTEDYVVQDYVSLLLRDNAALRKQRSVLNYRWLTPSGRYVMRRMLWVALVWLELSVIGFMVQRVMEVGQERDRAPAAAHAERR